MGKSRRAPKAPKAPRTRGAIHLLLADGPAQAPLPYWVLLAPLLLFAAVISFSRITSHDVWWHIKTGEWILQHRAIPFSDPFSFTAAGGSWTAHEWLFGVLSFLAYQAVGLTGLITLKSLIIALLLALTAATARLRGAGAGMTLLALACAFAVSRQRFDERPELISLCIAAAFLWIHEKSRTQEGHLFLLPILQLAWANLHGGTALLGWGLTAAFLLDRVKECRESGLTWRQIASPGGQMRAHFWTFAGVIAVSFANPYMARTLTYGTLRAGSPLHIEEFQSLAARMSLGPDLAITLLLAYAITLTALFFLRPRRVRASEWLLLPVLLILCIQFFRFRSLFTFLLAPSLAWHLSLGRVPGRLRWWLPSLLSLLLLIRIAAADSRSYGYRFGAGVHPGVLPVDAAEFIKSSGLSGRMFNEYEFGGYLIWRLWPEIKVFIDGREDVYVRPGIAAAYANRFRSAEDWKNLTAAYGIDFVVVKYPESPPSRPEQSLEGLAFPRSEWALVYFDDLAVIYVRRNGTNAEVIRQKEIFTVQPLQLSSYLDDIVNNPDRQERFLSEMNDTLRTRPDSFRTHFLLGIYSIKRGPQFWPQAAEEFRRSVAVNPEYIPAWLNLGGVCRQLGKISEAKDSYRQALSLKEDAAVRRQLEQLEGRARNN